MLRIGGGTPADSIVLKLEMSGKYYRTANTTQTEAGSYKLSEEKSNTGTNKTVINFSPHTGNSYTTYMHLYNDTLVLEYTGFSTDGIAWGYKKL